MTTSIITMRLLQRGAHANPRRGSNILELASVLAGEPWSTTPQSVHPALAAVAGPVNDLLSDDCRLLLAPIAPWLIGTNRDDPRIWPAMASVCIRAALAGSSEQNQLRLLADLDVARRSLAKASSPRQHGLHLGPRRRPWARHVTHAAQLLASSAQRGDADDALCQMLVHCLNEWQRLSGQRAVDPRLPLAQCPRSLAVQRRVIWQPGCDWMQMSYQPVPELLPPCLRREQPHWATSNHE
jgi:hypothetical protein